MTAAIEASEPLTSWERKWVQLAKFVSCWSKDPRTQVGCVLAKGSEFLAFGYNGFPAKIADDERLLNREFKNQVVLHAEENALRKVNWKDVIDATAFVVPLHPCPKCTSQLIQAGVNKIVFQRPDIQRAANYNIDLTRELCKEANIEIIEVYNA